MTVLTLKSQPRALLEAEAIRPENLDRRPAAEIARLMVTHGSEPALLGDFFDVAGDGSLEIVLNGDLSRVKNIAARMTQGKVVVNGHAGNSTALATCLTDLYAEKRIRVCLNAWCKNVCSSGQP